MDAPAQPPASQSSDHSQERSSTRSAEDSRPTATIIINVEPSNSNWTLLKRVQSAISKSSKFDISVPHDLVAEFIAEMKRLEDDHSEQIIAAAHWQKVAHKGLEEVDTLRTELRNYPTCIVKGHRSLADELQAKEVQLQMMAQFVAQYQKEKFAPAPDGHKASA